MAARCDPDRRVLASAGSKRRCSSRASTSADATLITAHVPAVPRVRASGLPHCFIILGSSACRRWSITWRPSSRNWERRRAAGSRGAGETADRAFWDARPWHPTLPSGCCRAVAPDPVAILGGQSKVAAALYALPSMPTGPNARIFRRARGSTCSASSWRAGLRTVLGFFAPGFFGLAFITTCSAPCRPRGATISCSYYRHPTPLAAGTRFSRLRLPFLIRSQESDHVRQPRRTKSSSVTFRIRAANEWESVATRRPLQGQTVVVFSLPGRSRRPALPCTCRAKRAGAGFTLTEWTRSSAVSVNDPSS